MKTEKMTFRAIDMDWNEFIFCAYTYEGAEYTSWLWFDGAMYDLYVWCKLSDRFGDYGWKNVQEVYKVWTPKRWEAFTTRCADLQYGA